MSAMDPGKQDAGAHAPQREYKTSSFHVESLEHIYRVGSMDLSAARVIKRSILAPQQQQQRVKAHENGDPREVNESHACSENIDQHQQNMKICRRCGRQRNAGSSSSSSERTQSRAATPEPLNTNQTVLMRSPDSINSRSLIRQRTHLSPSTFDNKSHHHSTRSLIRHDEDQYVRYNYVAPSHGVTTPSPAHGSKNSVSPQRFRETVSTLQGANTVTFLWDDETRPTPSAFTGENGAVEEIKVPPIHLSFHLSLPSQSASSGHPLTEAKHGDSNTFDSHRSNGHRDGQFTHRDTDSLSNNWQQTILNQSRSGSPVSAERHIHYHFHGDSDDDEEEAQIPRQQKEINEHYRRVRDEVFGVRQEPGALEDLGPNTHSSIPSRHPYRSLLPQYAEYLTSSYDDTQHGRRSTKQQIVSFYENVEASRKAVQVPRPVAQNIGHNRRARRNRIEDPAERQRILLSLQAIQKEGRNKVTRPTSHQIKAVRSDYYFERNSKTSAIGRARSSDTVHRQEKATSTASTSQTDLQQNTAERSQSAEPFSAGIILGDTVMSTAYMYGDGTTRRSIASDAVVHRHAGGTDRAAWHVIALRGLEALEGERRAGKVRLEAACRANLTARAHSWGILPLAEHDSEVSVPASQYHASVSAVRNSNQASSNSPHCKMPTVADDYTIQPRKDDPVNRMRSNTAAMADAAFVQNASQRSSSAQSPLSPPSPEVLQRCILRFDSPPKPADQTNHVNEERKGKVELVAQVHEHQPSGIFRYKHNEYPMITKVQSNCTVEGVVMSGEFSRDLIEGSHKGSELVSSPHHQKHGRCFAGMPVLELDPEAETPPSRDNYDRATGERISRSEAILGKHDTRHGDQISRFAISSDAQQHYPQWQSSTSGFKWSQHAQNRTKKSDEKKSTQPAEEEEPTIEGIELFGSLPSNFSPIESFPTPYFHVPVANHGENAACHVEETFSSDHFNRSLYTVGGGATVEAIEIQKVINELPPESVRNRHNLLHQHQQSFSTSTQSIVTPSSASGQKKSRFTVKRR